MSWRQRAILDNDENKNNIIFCRRARYWDPRRRRCHQLTRIKFNEIVITRQTSIHFRFDREYTQRMAFMAAQMERKWCVTAKL